MLSFGPSLLLAATLAGCRLFVAGDYYTRNITDAPVDANSSSYIEAMRTAGNTDGFWAAGHPVEYVNLADRNVPVLHVHQKVRYHRLDWSVPWADDFKIEPLADRHAIVIATDRCELYETYDTTYASGMLSAYGGAHWNMRRPFVPLPPGTPSSMASGLSLYAGMILWEEVAAGRIDHALNWAPPAHTAAQWDFVRPASDTDGLAFNGNRYALPYGAHLRLHAKFDISRLAPQSAIIARAMKSYGIYLADTGSQGNALYNAVPLDGNAHWDSQDLAGLSAIHISDFDLLSLGTIGRVPGH